MTADDNETPISELGYEEARDELVEVVRVLEAGGQDLDTSLTLWERGEELAARCEEHLDGASRRVDAVLGGGDEAGADAVADEDEDVDV